MLRGVLSDTKKTAASRSLRGGGAAGGAEHAGAQHLTPAFGACHVGVLCVLGPRQRPIANEDGRRHDMVGEVRAIC